MDQAAIDAAIAAAVEHGDHNALLPAMVAGRTLQLDADFLAYMVTAEGKEEKTWQDMQHNAREMIANFKALSGSEFVTLHLTPNNSNKGMRSEVALQQPYQGNRKDKPKPRYLHVMRKWLAEEFQGILHLNCEADDGMTGAQYKALANGTPDLSVICSKDKDLRMCQGWHMDWDTGSMELVDGFGRIELIHKESPTGVKSTKPYGFGAAWFWYQMLIGDQADHIKGLPSIHPTVMNTMFPTQTTSKALSVIASGTSTAKQRASAEKVISQRKHGLCGPVAAYTILENVKDNQTAYNVVSALYQLHGDSVGFTNYRTGDPVSWQAVFISEAIMLWMRRYNIDDPADVVHWFAEIKAGRE